jgi:AraC-like DNA-binding protein
MLSEFGMGMTGIAFSSASLPDHLDDRHRYNLWRDIFTSQLGKFDFSASGNLPFAATMEFSLVDTITVLRITSTLEQINRTARWVATDGRDDYHLLVNHGAAMNGVAARREYELPSGGTVLMSSSSPGLIARPATGINDVWVNVTVPGPMLRAAVENPDDLLARGMPPGTKAATLLSNYVEFLRQQGEDSSSEIREHKARTLLDLVALTLGAKGEKAELASARGLRVARLHAALGQIKHRFSEVGFSTHDVAAALRISVRYVNDILQESGTGFSDRVLELRLQRARAMLSDRRNDGMRIGDIAYASGFSDISHFNRSFRRRFGLTPTCAR